MIEFVLAYTVLFPIILGTYQFGHGMMAYNELVNAVRTGARYASLRTYDSANETPSAAFENAVKNMTVYGNVDGTGSPVCKGLQTSQVDVKPSFFQGGVNREVPVSMTVAINGYQLNTFLRTFTLRRPSARFIYSGRWAPPLN
jgi:Flp pilus assembly protein TadG